MANKKARRNASRVPSSSDELQASKPEEQADQGSSSNNANIGTQAQDTEQSSNSTSLTVDGSPYAPVSLKKMKDQGHFDKADDTSEERSLTVIIPCANGLEADDPDIVNVMIKDRVMQAEYFINEIFPKLPRIPAYLYRYIQWLMFDDGSYNGKYDQMKYPTDNDYVQALAGGLLKKEDKEYQEVEGFIKWGKSNTEATHLIGLLQLVGGTLRSYAKKNSGCRMFIELPETGFHPKRERLLVTLLYKLREEYGVKANWTEINSEDTV